jgi:hypothetical protein
LPAKSPCRLDVELENPRLDVSKKPAPQDQQARRNPLEPPIGRYRTVAPPLTGRVDGRRRRGRLGINNGAGRRWRHNCRSRRRLYHPLFLNATRSQRGHADASGNKGKTFHVGAPVECFSHNDEDVPRLHGWWPFMMLRGCFGTSSSAARPGLTLRGLRRYS